MSALDIITSRNIEQLKKSNAATVFDFKMLRGPFIYNVVPKDACDAIAKLCTSPRYSAKYEYKKETIDSIMDLYGFYHFAAGTNRHVYYHRNDNRFVVKIGYDRVGAYDNRAEMSAQWAIEPFCAKVFSVDDSGVLATVERVNPISNIEEFESVAENVFWMMVTKIIGKYVTNDMGARFYMNYGIRNGFGPVVLDYPNIWEADPEKFICQICGGDIDYDDDLSLLKCTKCGHVYDAKDLAKNSDELLRVKISEENMGGVFNFREEFNDIIGGGTLTLEDGTKIKMPSYSKWRYAQMSKSFIPTGSFRVSGFVRANTPYKQRTTLSEKRESVGRRLQEESGLLNMLPPLPNDTVLSSEPLRINRFSSKDKSDNNNSVDVVVNSSIDDEVNDVEYGEERIGTPLSTIINAIFGDGVASPNEYFGYDFPDPIDVEYELEEDDEKEGEKSV